MFRRQLQTTQLTNRGLVIPVKLKKLDQSVRVNAHVSICQQRNTIAAEIVAKLNIEIRQVHNVDDDCFLDVKLANGRKFKRQRFFIIYGVSDIVSLGDDFFGNLKQLRLLSGLPSSRVLSVHFGRNPLLCILPNVFLNGILVSVDFDTSTAINYVSPIEARNRTIIQLGNFTETRFDGEVVTTNESCKIDLKVGEDSYPDQLFYVNPVLTKGAVLGLSILENYCKVVFNYSEATVQDLEIDMSLGSYFK